MRHMSLVGSSTHPDMALMPSLLHCVLNVLVMLFYLFVFVMKDS